MLDSPKLQLNMSVQDRTEEAAASEAPLTFVLAGIGDTIPPWGTLGNVHSRDRALSAFWHTEPILAGAVTAMCFKMAALDYKWKGPARKVKRCDMMFRNADFGQGWPMLVSKLTSDILTRDNGGFIELMRRQRNDPNSPNTQLIELHGYNNDKNRVTALILYHYRNERRSG